MSTTKPVTGTRINRKKNGTDHGTDKNLKGNDNNNVVKRKQHHLQKQSSTMQPVSVALPELPKLPVPVKFINNDDDKCNNGKMMSNKRDDSTMATKVATAYAILYQNGNGGNIIKSNNGKQPGMSDKSEKSRRPTSLRNIVKRIRWLSADNKRNSTNGKCGPTNGLPANDAHVSNRQSLTFINYGTKLNFSFFSHLFSHSLHFSFI